MTVVDGAAAGRAVSVGSERRGALRFDGPALDLLLVAAVALPFALRFPVATSVLALAAFGLVHTFLELRWVLARFRDFISGSFLAVCCVPVTLIALTRLLGGARAIEITAGFALLAAAVVQGYRTGRLTKAPAAVAAAALAIGLAASLDAPVMYGIVLAHLHNVVTGFLLWEWSSDMAEDRRRAFRAVVAGLFVALPAFVLLGAADAVLPASVKGLVVGTVTPGWAGAAMGVRLMAAFALLQVVHYGVWCWLLPRRSTGPTAPSRIDGSWLAAAIAAAAVLALVFRTDYATGRTLYTSLATYHAYLEFPVVLVLLGGSRASR